MTIISRFGLQRPVRYAVLALVALAPGCRAVAGTIDTLTGLTPGDLIGCDYTFQNGDPSIPCAKDKVGKDGTVSFLKPDAPFDNIEYFDVTTSKDILEIITPPNTPVIPKLTPGDQYPHFGSFFDIFVTIDLMSFNNTGLELPGAISPGETFNFNDGTSQTLPDVTISGFTGTVNGIGFDVVSNSPEPSTLLLFGTGLGALCAWPGRLCRPGSGPPAKKF